MWVLTVVVIVTAITGHFATSYLNATEAVVAEKKASVLAVNMAVYRQAVLKYLRTNPAFNGTVPDGSLTFPTGYTRNPAWTNIVSAGNVAVYPGTTLPVDILSDLVRISEGSYFAGRSTGGMIFSPVRGNTGITLPSGTPNNVAVWAGRVS